MNVADTVCVFMLFIIRRRAPHGMLILKKMRTSEHYVPLNPVIEVDKITCRIQQKHKPSQQAEEWNDKKCLDEYMHSIMTQTSLWHGRVAMSRLLLSALCV